MRLGLPRSHPPPSFNSVIEIRYQRGLHLPEADLWLDPPGAKPWAFVSHAHSDHFARHRQILCSPTTAALLRTRYSVREDRIQAVDLHTPVEVHGFRLQLLPAGHIAGSAMLHATRLSDGATLLYTGDFKMRDCRTAESAVFKQADLLVIETTFGLPRFIFPPREQVEECVLQFVRGTLTDGDVPILLSYSLGKSQEALALLHAHGIPVLQHPSVAAMTHACRTAGVPGLPEEIREAVPDELLAGKVPKNHAIIVPPGTSWLRRLGEAGGFRTAMLSGWALLSSASHRFRVDEVIPLSDHADHSELWECVRQVQPRRILTVHGYTHEFAAELRRHGHDAWSAEGGDQLELPLPTPAQNDSAPIPAHPPASSLATFGRVCRAAGETRSRREKVSLLASYLRDLEDDEELAIASAWLAGRVFPTGANWSSPRVFAAVLRRSLIELPRVTGGRLRELFHLAPDGAAAARRVLQELALEALPTTLIELAEFIRAFAPIKDTPNGIALLTDRLRTLHPADSEILLKLIGSGLRIGMREEHLTAVIALAFEADPDQIARSLAESGDPGRTAVQARHGTLGRI